MHQALFLDRDGVLNIDHGYVHRPEDFQVIDGVFDTLRLAQDQGYALIVVTNQSGIARGLFDQQSYDALEAHMRAVFAAEGIFFTAVYHCPHHPDGNVSPINIECDCRKPHPGMILRASHDHHIDLPRSIMVGDKDSDVQAAEAAGVGEIHLIDAHTNGLADVWRARSSTIG